MSVLAAVLALAYTSMVPLSVFCLTMAVPPGLGTGAVFKLLPDGSPTALIAPSEFDRQRGGVHRQHPHPAGHFGVLAGHDVPWETSTIAPTAVGTSSRDA